MGIERIRFLKKVIGFACSITRTQGKRLENTSHSVHLHTIYELLNFGGFSFYVDSGQTMFGGDTVKIWYHPSRPHTKRAGPVLDISWGLDLNNPSHVYFDPNLEWQKEILKVVRWQKKIAARINKPAGVEP
jgi:hypothetical protein